jgi:hypothetical protein
MRPLYYRWLVSPAMFVLILILAACGGGSATSPTSGGTANTPNAHPSQNMTSTLSFMASGELSGLHTFSSAPGVAAGAIDKVSNSKTLSIGVSNQSLRFMVKFSPYTGPVSYNLTSRSGFVGVSNLDNTKQWTLVYPSSCQLNVISDTSLNTQGNGMDEIRGTFSCSSLVTMNHTAEPIVLSNGQFDLALPLVTD